MHIYVLAVLCVMIVDDSCFHGKKPLKYPRFQGGSDPVTNVLATLQSHIYIQLLLAE